MNVLIRRVLDPTQRLTRSTPDPTSVSTARTHSKGWLLCFIHRFITFASLMELNATQGQTRRTQLLVQQLQVCVGQSQLAGKGKTFEPLDVFHLLHKFMWWRSDTAHLNYTAEEDRWGSRVIAAADTAAAWLQFSEVVCSVQMLKGVFCYLSYQIVYLSAEFELSCISDKWMFL